MSDFSSKRNFGFVGLGLMGGSFAKAIRMISQNTGGQWLKADKLFALDSNPLSLREAEENGIIDEVFPPEKAGEMLNCCDVVFICLYPKNAIEFLKKHREEFKSGAIVTDISGVKTPLMQEMRDILRPDVDFICGHPMAGSEKEGYLNADWNIFKGRNYILMRLPSNKTENIEFFKDLMWKIGFSRITETDVATHDHKIAFTSQLCHIIASALVESAEDAEITAFGGGSFEDLTRIAMINAPLWTELFLANKENLLSHIDSFEDALQKIKNYIKTENAEELSETLDQIRKKRITMVRRESAPRAGLSPENQKKDEKHTGDKL
ncbi:MAG: prephenate dehydrogenase [Spirochaetaceae bacterium]|jgi:prephenate dehydrogenase|nr:prephenate dehydrogenase [Spirochaetaceae bacterium]